MIQLRPYQTEAVESIDRFFRSNLGNPLVVAPTGSGKSMMIAAYVSQCIRAFPKTKIMVLAHVKELIEQNTQALNEYDPTVDRGQFSAGLNKKDRDNDVIFGGIQSVWNKADLFGYVDMVIVDEAHMISPQKETRYRQFMAGLKLRNKNVKVIGFTATPFRLGHGWIHTGGDSLFDGISYTIPITDLIEQGYLAKPVAKSGAVHADLSNVHTRGGEFVESEASAAFQTITAKAVKDIVLRTQTRKCGLIFCTGIEHAELTVASFKALGQHSVKMVTGTTSKADRAILVDEVKTGKLRWLVNVAVFTTGFDAPNIDVIGLLRATQSAALYIQMVGRGLRLAQDKTDCLILDYGENVKRHGPLNFVYIKQPGERIPKDTVRAKDCPQCEQLVPVNASECPYCHYQFPQIPREITHGTEAGELDIMAMQEPHWVDVIGATYSKHTKLGKVPSMRVRYSVGIGQEVSEWICFEHGGYATGRAYEWSEARGFGRLSLDEALDVKWPCPKRIQIKRLDSSFFKVIGYEF